MKPYATNTSNSGCRSVSPTSSFKLVLQQHRKHATSGSQAVPTNGTRGPRLVTFRLPFRGTTGTTSSERSWGTACGLPLGQREDLIPHGRSCLLHLCLRFLLSLPSVGAGHPVRFQRIPDTHDEWDAVHSDTIGRIIGMVEKGSNPGAACLPVPLGVSGSCLGTGMDERSLDERSHRIWLAYSRAYMVLRGCFTRVRKSE